ncbi:MAG: hypothetical protein AAB975_02180, partial [Patescibacteria group bacterium]
ILAAKPSDLLGVGTATPRQSSGFSLNISQNGSGKKITNRLLPLLSSLFLREEIEVRDRN